MKFLDEKNIRTFGKSYVKLLAKLLQKAGKKSSGKLIQSLDYRLQETAEAINYQLEANDYFQYVDEGRKPGTYPNISELGKWVSINGISQNAIFPIARNIFKFGIEPTNIHTKAEIELLNNNKYTNEIENAMSNNIEQIISEIFKEKKNL